MTFAVARSSDDESSRAFFEEESLHPRFRERFLDMGNYAVQGACRTGPEPSEEEAGLRGADLDTLVVRNDSIYLIACEVVRGAVNFLRLIFNSLVECVADFREGIKLT